MTDVDDSVREGVPLVKEADHIRYVLTNYDPGRPLRLACDASAVGIYSVLSHIKEDGPERP